MKAEQLYDRDYERDPHTMELVWDIHRRWASGRSALDLLHQTVPLWDGAAA
jgi:hypothetical protein